jgi:hypothetical protein
MASAALSRRVGKVVANPPLCELSDLQRRVGAGGKLTLLRRLKMHPV